MKKKKLVSKKKCCFFIMCRDDKENISLENDSDEKKREDIFVDGMSSTVCLFVDPSLLQRCDLRKKQNAAAASILFLIEWRCFRLLLRIHRQTDKIN